MTTVIDHAIAIPTRPANVWQVISDISNLPTWHPDSQRVQYLSTMKSGRGTRWRNTTNSNKEQVVEITAWYDGLGYEYRIIDGSSYPQNRGRIRLQEAPEGTVVQWTFSYHTSGFFNNLRNNLSLKGRADKEVIQGLRNLYVFVKDSKLDENLNPELSKAYLKEAPNVEERASYQPRYPSKVSDGDVVQEIEADKDVVFKPPSEKQLQPVVSVAKIVEPALTDEDTHPNPVIEKTDDVPAVKQSKEPDFLKTMPDPAPHIQEEQDKASVPAPDISSRAESREVEAKVVAESPVQAQEEQKPATVTAETQGQDTGKLDTSTVSVFELFGIEKPSETEKVQTLREMPAVTESVSIESPVESVDTKKAFEDSTPIIPDIKPELPSRRTGLRAALRGRFVKVRSPRSD